MPAPPPPLREWLLSWIAADGSPRDRPDSLPSFAWHARDAWSRRTEPNVVLIHYADLSADLPGQMRQLAARLGIMVPGPRWPGLVSAATFASMRANASRLVQGPPGILLDDTGFFRQGRSGAARDALTSGDLARYYTRMAELAPPDVLAWLHRP